MIKHRKSILASILILTILVSTLLSASTIAFFTDEVQTGINRIETGKLDVSLKHSNAFIKTAVTVDANTEMFVNTSGEDIRWEPGAVSYENLEITNDGNLALAYQLRMNYVDENYLLDGMEKRVLSDVIKAGVIPGGVTDGMTRQDALDAVSIWYPLNQIDYRGTLNTTGESNTVALLLYWEPTTSDNSWNANGGKTLYNVENNSVDTLNTALRIDLGVRLTAAQAEYESDVFGSDYDKDAAPAITGFAGGTAVSSVVVDADGKLSSGVNLMSADGVVSAYVPAGVQLVAGTKQIKLVVIPMAETASNVTAEEDENMQSVDVYIEGVSDNNTVPMQITLNEILSTGLNKGNIDLYHVENNATIGMNEVDTTTEFTVHNQFVYYPETGTLTLNLASFSEVAVVADDAAVWKGATDTSWYNPEEPATDYTISNADQLAGLGQLVAGNNNFAGKTIKLTNDIDMDGEAVVGENGKLKFYPIGYTSEGYKGTFSGTFDGHGHKISNIYQNTWMLAGNYDKGYYNAAMGLFGYVEGGTVKNLTINNFQSDGEFAPTGCVAAYAVNSTFENIALTNCNPRVYNTGNGGIVGIGGNNDDSDTYKLTFNNITIDNTNKITALWGSWDVACGGLVGMFRGAGHVYMTNCHVAAQIDVYNDVCGNYQYYWYRYSGMMVGTNKNMITDKDGYTVPETSKFHAENCTVHFGEWNDYYYCELVANSLASYTHDHQFSRLEEVDSVDVDNNTVIIGGETIAIPTSGKYNYVVVNGESSTDNAVCYHFVDGAQWTHDKAGTETINGKTVLKEDKQHIYLPFNQLFTGYGWGVKHIPVYNGEDYAFEGITILDRPVANSVEKFARADTAKKNYTTGTSVTIGDLFKAAEIKDNKLKIKPDKVQVFVSPVGEDSTAGGTYEANSGDWTKGTLTFSGTGAATITITDYYFCTPMTINVTIVDKQSAEKFETKFTGDFLYRVGNQNSVSIGSLFAAKKDNETEKEAIINSSGVVASIVKVDEDMNVSGTFTPNTTDWTKGTIQFSGTGVVKVTITDNDYCTPTELLLEVVEAKNITKAESATANNVVLLNDISGTFVVSNGYTFYGNGFTVTLPTTSVQNIGNGFTGYISIGASQDDGIANGGNLDNVRIEGPVYPEMYIYRDQAKITDKNDPDYGDGYNMRYFRNSVIVYGGNCTISNSYISGSRTALCLRGGNNVVIENTTLSGGAYANMQICAGSNVTLRDLTTVQVDVADSYGKGKTAHGLGIAVDSDVVDLYIEGELNQYNWLNQTQWNNIVPSTYQSTFPKFFTEGKFEKYWHYLDGGTDPYVNMAFIYACNWDTSKIHDNRTTVDYGTCAATIATVSGGVYSKINTVGGNAITAANLADPGYTSPGFNPIAPVFNFDNTENNDADDANDANDTYCVYNESTGSLKIGVSGDSKTLDLSKVNVTKNGATLAHTAYLNGTQISGNSVTIKAADGAKQTLTFKATSKDKGYDKDGNPIAGSIEYTWSVTVEIAVLSYPAPVWNMGGEYQFDTSNCYYAYYQTSQGYGEAVPIYEGIKVNYYNKSGTLVNLDLSGTTTHPTGSENSNANAFTYTLTDGSTLTMKFSSGWKSGATTHQFTTYNNKVYIYPQSLDNDNYVRAKTTNQDFDVKISYTFTDPNGQSISQTMRWYNAKASNNSVKTEQWKTFDSTNGKNASICVTPDTLVTLADGSQVRIDSLSGNEQLLVWNHQTASFDTAPVAYIVNHDKEEREQEVIHLYFDNGSNVSIIGEHVFFDAELNKYVALDAGAEQYIGHNFTIMDENGIGSAELVKVEKETKLTQAYEVVSYQHLTCFTNGVLSASAYMDQLLNIFDINPDTMGYTAEEVQKDIETYGLYTYADFEGLIEEEAFELYNAAYLKIAVGKGYITWDDVLKLIDIYFDVEVEPLL